MISKALSRPSSGPGVRGEHIFCLDNFLLHTPSTWIRPLFLHAGPHFSQAVIATVHLKRRDQWYKKKPTDGQTR
jgi:hypothetical protein